jgi:Flp pilus assembly protein TadD
MKQKVFIAIAAAIISAFTSVSSAQPKASLPTSQPSKSLPALSEEQIKNLILSETEKKDALRGQAEAERKFNFTMTWVQVLLAGVSALAIIPVLLGLFFLIFRKSIFGQLNAEATKEVKNQVEAHLKKTIDTEVEVQVFALIERIKKLNQLVQELEALVPASTQVEPSPEILSRIDHLQRQIEDFQDLFPTLMQPAEYYFKQGNVFYFEGQYKEAISSIDKALELKPGNSEAWSNRGVALASLNRYEEAISSYDEALKLKPDFSQVWSSRGVALDSLNRYEEAIISYDKALELKPDNSEAWFNRGVALDSLNRYEEAITSYDKAVELKLDNSEAWSNRGVALGYLKRYKEAITSHEKALEFKPDDPHIWYNKACCYALQEKVEETVHDLEKAIELDSTCLEKAKTDLDFDKIRHYERFQNLLNVEL